MIVRAASVVCLVLTLTVARPASAQAHNPLIQQGQSQYDDLRFEEALQTLSAALVRAGNSDEDRATIYRLLAFTYLALDREEEAAGAYRSLLALDPEFQPGSDVSPRFREFFAGVRQSWEADGRPGLPVPTGVTIRHRSPAQAQRGEPIELTADVDDPAHRVATLVLAYRQGSEDVFRRVDAVRRGDTLVATIPAEAVAPPLVEYYFEGLDATGLPVAARGDVAAPLRVAVPEPSRSVFSTWWFWTGVGVVVAAAATVIVLAATGTFGGGGQQQGTFLITVH